jgi:hypothetical protein
MKTASRIPEPTCENAVVSVGHRQNHQHIMNLTVNASLMRYVGKACPDLSTKTRIDPQGFLALNIAYIRSREVGQRMHDDETHICCTNKSQQNDEELVNMPPSCAFWEVSAETRH